MKILFIGPTLFDVARPGHLLAGTDILCRPPAQQGDIARAVLDGASAIGLIDGRYEDVAAPWHKEILYALSRGVAVLGGASMGALRAAECAPFGMVPVGRVAERYLCGDLTDDAAVAQIHAPPELGCKPLSEALVNIEATVENARACDAISCYEADVLKVTANRMFFKDRTFQAIVSAGGFAGDYALVLMNTMRDCRRDIKREDALALVERLRAPIKAPNASHWTFRETTAWRRFFEAIR